MASLTKTVEALVELELQVGVAAAQGNFSKAIDLAVDVQVTTKKNALTMENEGLGKGQEDTGERERELKRGVWTGVLMCRRTRI